MATSVSTVEDVRLDDGTDITLKSLSITGMRKFMKRAEEFAKSEDEDEFFEAVINAAAFCIAKQRPEFFNEKKDNGEGKVGGGSTEAFEDAVDMPTIYKILEICGGIKLNDPNLLAAAAQAAGLGTN